MKLLLISLIFASQPRIASYTGDESKVQKIYIKPGLVSKMRLPCDIKEVVNPKTSNFHVQISEKYKNELNYSFLDTSAKAINIIVNCKGQRTFIFDLVPSTRTHIDLVKVGAFQLKNKKLISSSDDKNNTPRIKKKLIKRSKE
tara:strand:+ start:4963 stop:5391 length:429 start_codon:yes stop_codon:yes gene_type:complete